MIIKNPKNTFFTLYSSKTIAENEEYAKKYLNYEMHKFPDNEIDIEDQKQLEKNIENIENIEIFDENIYKHGMYYNTFFQENNLKIYFYIGKIDYKELNFNIIDYFKYLFNCDSLIEILKAKNYLHLTIILKLICQIILIIMIISV